jgi:hypothetical protein
MCLHCIAEDVDVDFEDEVEEVATVGGNSQAVKVLVLVLVVVDADVVKDTIHVVVAEVVPQPQTTRTGVAMSVTSVVISRTTVRPRLEDNRNQAIPFVGTGTP